MALHVISLCFQKGSRSLNMCFLLSMFLACDGEVTLMQGLCQLMASRQTHASLQVREWPWAIFALHPRDDRWSHEPHRANGMGLMEFSTASWDCQLTSWQYNSLSPASLPSFTKSPPFGAPQPPIEAHTPSHQPHLASKFLKNALIISLFPFNSTAGFF